MVVFGGCAGFGLRFLIVRCCMVYSLCSCLVGWVLRLFGLGVLGGAWVVIPI